MSDVPVTTKFGMPNPLVIAHDVAVQCATSLRHKRVQPSPDLCALLIVKIASGETYYAPRPKRSRRRIP